MKKYLLCLAVFLTATSILLYGCTSASESPKALVDKYFSSAVKQDYASAYSCYYKTYQDKISKEEYIKHRKEASLLQSYKIASIKENGNQAQAKVLLTFAPSKKLNRDKPVAVTVQEDLVKENGQWKIKVW